MLKLFITLSFCNVLFAMKINMNDVWQSGIYSYSHSYCIKGSLHVTFMHDGNFAPDCYKGGEIVKLTQKQKQLFIENTNAARDKTAAGGNAGLPKAARMGAVVSSLSLIFL
jgi:hypothetical protein